MEAENPVPEPSIGMVEMGPDGGLQLTLRAAGDQGQLGDARFDYPPGHPQIAVLLCHVGGLQPGERKAVPPWPSTCD